MTVLCVVALVPECPDGQGATFDSSTALHVLPVVVTAVAAAIYHVVLVVPELRII